MSAFSQEYSRSSLTYYIGKGSSDVGEPVGEGFFGGAGYQLNIWKDRLRFNPNISMGYYDAEHYLDLPDEMHFSINIEADFSTIY